MSRMPCENYWKVTIERVDTTKPPHEMVFQTEAQALDEVDKWPGRLVKLTPVPARLFRLLVGVGR